MIYDPATKRAVADSLAIATYLDTTYPATPTFLPRGTAALQAAFLVALEVTAGAPLYAIIDARTNAVLNPRSAVYHRAKSEVAFGDRLEAIGGAAEWTALEAGLSAVDGWLRANGPGRDELLMGDEVCFGDVQLAATLHWTRLVCGEDSEDWMRIAKLNEGKWRRIVETFDQYAAVDA